MSRRARKPATTEHGQVRGSIRCAIYTRKSSDEGLDQEFNSLDAQRESAEAFIASQKAEGWTALASRYDDGGYSGGSMERPALERLLCDIDEGKIDCVVVYKVDRLARIIHARFGVMLVWLDDGVRGGCWGAEVVGGRDQRRRPPSPQARWGRVGVGL